MKVAFSITQSIQRSLKTCHFSAESWSSVLNTLSSNGEHLQVLLSYSSMVSHGVSPNPYTFTLLLKACANLESIKVVFSIHQHIITYGYESDVYLASSLVHVYAKCGEIFSAHKLFDRMPYRSVVPWTSIITGYSRLGDIRMAFSLWNKMQHYGIRPNSISILGLLSGISWLGHLESLHACVIHLGLECDLVLVNSLLHNYANCRKMDISQKLFNGLSNPDRISWNSLISGYSQNGCLGKAMNCLNKMRNNIKPDPQTYGSITYAVTGEGTLKIGKTIHSQIITSGFEKDVQLQTSLVGMYMKCGDVYNGTVLFTQIAGQEKDAVLWTIVISGFLHNDQANMSIRIFHEMLMSKVSPINATIASALAACAQLSALKLGTSIHGYVIRNMVQIDIIVENSLITMYTKCGYLNKSQVIFDRMSNKDVVSWNSIILGYSQGGFLNKALMLFNHMNKSSQMSDSITFISLLQACASLGSLHHGKSIHNFITKSQIHSCISIDTALVDMYSKCGKFETAYKCFNQMPYHDVVCWSAIISGYGIHGKGDIALRLYSEFLRLGFRPNHVTFLSVLSACSHSGKVSKGIETFISMKKDFEIEPKLEHCACVIDLLCRAGQIQEAYRFMKKMLPQPTLEVLGMLLDACKVHRNSDIGEKIAKEILTLRPNNAGIYVQLAHTFASFKKWDYVGEIWTTMRKQGLRKEPGWSFIELHGIVTTFFVDHTSHPQHDEMMSMLNIMDIEMSIKYDRPSVFC